MVDPFLTEYQKHTDYRIDDDDEAMETIHKHHKFLLKQMIEEREGIDWSQTHLWRHLLETYAEEVETLRASLARLRTDSRDSEMEANEEEIQSSEETENSAPSKSESSSEVDAKEESSEDEEQMIDWTKTIWDMLNVLRKSPNFNMRHCGIEKLADELRRLPTFTSDHKAAVAAIERSAAELIRLMNEAKLRKKFNWSTRAIYDELEATLAGDIAEQIMITPAQKRGKQRHRMKSVLRPSGAGKASKRTRGIPDSQDEDEEMRDIPISSPVTKRHSVRSGRVPEQNFDYGREEDSPSRQLNGHYDPDGLPELPPPPETQEMLELVAKEAKLVGRQHQTSHLEAFLGQWIL